MSGYSATSRAAFATVDLQAAEAEVLVAIRKHFGDGRKFTRAELADAMGWAINRITGRVLSLIERGLLEESETTIACPVTGGNAHQVWLIDYTRGVPQSNAAMAASRLPSHGRSAEQRELRGSGSPETRGTGGDAASEERRHACEVRHVANLPDDSARRLFLVGVREKRGQAAYERLRTDVWRLMQRVAA